MILFHSWMNCSRRFLSWCHSRPRFCLNVKNSISYLQAFSFLLNNSYSMLMQIRRSCIVKQLIRSKHINIQCITCKIVFQSWHKQLDNTVQKIPLSRSVYDMFVSFQLHKDNKKIPLVPVNSHINMWIWRVLWCMSCDQIFGKTVLKQDIV